MKLFISEVTECQTSAWVAQRPLDSRAPIQYKDALLPV